MDDNLEEKIIQSFEALENGRTLDQVLSMFPEDADTLRPILETAGILSGMRVAHSIQSQYR